MRLALAASARRVQWRDCQSATLTLRIGSVATPPGDGGPIWILWPVDSDPSIRPSGDQNGAVPTLTSCITPVASSTTRIIGLGLNDGAVSKAMRVPSGDQSR